MRVEGETAVHMDGELPDCPEIGERIVVRTPDRREFRGWMVGRRDSAALVRLDTGWVTAFPLRMVHRDGLLRSGSDPSA